MTEKQINFFWFLLECLVGTAIGYAIYRVYPILGQWCLISIILVISPDRKDSINLALNRIKANFIGCSIGLLLFFIQPPNLWMISLGIVSALAVCELTKLQSVNRTAIIAILIITMHEPGQHFWDIALERAGGVFAGCLIGVLLTYVFHIVITRLKRNTNR